MQLTILLIFALDIFAAQSRCFHDYGPGWGWQHSSKYNNYHCVPREKCFDSQYNLTPEQKRVTQTGQCINRGGVFDFGQVCCLHQSPPQRRHPNFNRRTPIRNPSSRPVTNQLNRIHQSQRGQHGSTHISSQAHQRPQSPTSSTIFHSQNAKCQCIHRRRCLDNQKTSPFRQVICPNNNEVCCHSIFQPSSSSSPNQSPQPRPPQTSHQTHTRVPSFRPTTQRPSQTTSQVTISNMVAQPQPPRPSEIFPLDKECTCTPFFRCYDDETSSNLTGLVDDRTFTQQSSCPSSNEVCCHNLDPPPPTPIRNPSSQSQSQSIGLSENNRNVNCECIPFNECHDDDIHSNPSSLIDVHRNDRPLKQDSCSHPNQICCHHLVHPLKPPNSNPLPQRPIVTQTPQPQNQKPFQVPSQRPTVGSSQPAQTSSPSSNCLCTPFFKCYDEETSSNLTGIVDDRSFVPVAKTTCEDPNEICCHNLIKPQVILPTVSFSEDCNGTCVPIEECPNFSNLLEEARNGRSEAVQQLRESACSRTDERVNVCCPQIHFNG